MAASVKVHIFNKSIPKYRIITRESHTTATSTSLVSVRFFPVGLLEASKCIVILNIIRRLDRVYMLQDPSE